MKRRDDADSGLRPDEVPIVLSRGQVESVVRAVARDGGGAATSGAETESLYQFAHSKQLNDVQLSRSVQLGLAVLAACALGGVEHGIKELSANLGLNTSTIHRYIRTLMAVGLIEQNPTTRKYQLARP